MTSEMKNFVEAAIKLHQKVEDYVEITDMLSNKDASMFNPDISMANTLQSLSELLADKFAASIETDRLFEIARLFDMIATELDKIND